MEKTIIFVLVFISILSCSKKEVGPKSVKEETKCQCTEEAKSEPRHHSRW